MFNDFSSLSLDSNNDDELQDKFNIYIHIMQNIFKGTLKSLSQQAEVDGLQLKNYEISKYVKGGSINPYTIHTMFFANHNNTNCEVLMVFPIGILYFKTDVKKINTMINPMILTNHKQLDRFFVEYKTSDGKNRINEVTQELLVALLKGVENKVENCDYIGLQKIDYSLQQILEYNSDDVTSVVVQAFNDFIQL